VFPETLVFLSATYFSRPDDRRPSMGERGANAEREGPDPGEPESRDPVPTVGPDAFEGSDRYLVRPTAHTVGFLLAVCALAGLFVHDFTTSGPLLPYWTPVFGRVDVGRLDWLYFLALVLLTFWVVVPLAARPTRTRTYWRRLRADPVGTVALVAVVAFAFAGLVTPVLVGEPTIDPGASYQPPVGFGVDASATTGCVGEVVDGQCRGTWTHPFGTTFSGADVLSLTLVGTWTALRIAAVTATVIVPLAVAVGVTAGSLGGRVDSLLVGVADAVGVVPPFVAYVVARFVVGPGDLLLLVLAFALTGWGGVARTVRNEVLSRREAPFVSAARCAGAGRAWVAWRHLLPNVSGTVTAATAQQVSTLLLAEAALSFLEFGAPSVTSWGTVIRQGGSATFTASVLDTWWISLFPVLALATTVAAVSLLGDALRDALDPRT
jgi:peptide/nickel transport system permease protein